MNQVKTKLNIQQEVDRRRASALLDLQNEVERFDSLPDASMTDVAVFCALAHITAPTYYRGAKEGRFPAGYKIGALRRIPVSDVREFMKNPCEWAAKQQEGAA